MDRVLSSCEAGAGTYVRHDISGASGQYRNADRQIVKLPRPKPPVARPGSLAPDRHAIYPRSGVNQNIVAADAARHGLPPLRPLGSFR